MYAQVLGSTTFGLNGHVIGVEVDINKNFPSFDIVGLPTTAVKESKERVHSAIRNSGYHFPVDKVTVNLAPADLKKDGSGLDLPIAVGLLAASGDVAKEALEGRVAGQVDAVGVLEPDQVRDAAHQVLQQAAAFFQLLHPAPRAHEPGHAPQGERDPQGEQHDSRHCVDEPPR